MNVDCSGHEISFIGPGTGAQPPVTLPLTSRDLLHVAGDKNVSLPLKIYNPRGTAMQNVRAVLTSDYPTVAVTRHSTELKEIGAGSAVDISNAFELKFVAAADELTRARLKLLLTYDGYQTAAQDIDVLIQPDQLAAPAEVSVLDGRTRLFTVFRQKGNQGEARR